MIDKLGDMFNRQVLFQKILENKVKSQEFMTEQALAMIVETGEMLQETNWKTWKKAKPIDKDKLKMEIMDMWHFMINISLAAELTARDIHDAFIEKSKINLKRQEEDY